MIRYKAFAIHLALSIILIASITGLFIWFWFPLPHFFIEGGWRGLRLIAAVDCVIGPMITLIIYNPKKSRGKLLFDLTVIALIQALAMGGGLLTIAPKRIVATVYADGTLYPLNADDTLRIGGRLTELVENSTEIPVYVVVEMPGDPEARQQLRRQALSSGVPLFTHEELMTPLDEEARTQLSDDDVPPLEMRYLEQKEPIEKYFHAPDHSHELNYFIRTVSPNETYITVLSRKDFKLKGWIRGTYKKR